MKRQKDEASRSSGSQSLATIPRPEPITVGLDKSISIDYSALEPPRSLYDADYAWVRRRTGAVSLFFGKQDVDDPQVLRTRLEIRYPDASFLSHFWTTIDGRFRDKMQSFLKRLPPDSERAAVRPQQMKALKDHSDWANVDYVAHTATLASLDFFLLGPSGLALFVQGGGTSALQVAPVVRIHITTQELARLIDECEPVANAIGAELAEAGI